MPDLQPGYNQNADAFRGAAQALRHCARSDLAIEAILRRFADPALMRSSGMTVLTMRKGIKRCLKKACSQGKTHTGHRRRLRARCGDGTPLRRAWRRTDHLRPPARIAGGDRGADAQRTRRQGQRRQMRHPRRRRGRCHDGRGLARGAARRAGQQCRRDLHRADRASVVSRGGCDSGADPARRDVLHARCRQALDRRRRTRAWC